MGLFKKTDSSEKIHKLECDNKQLKKDLEKSVNENKELNEKIKQLNSTLSSMRIQHDAVMSEYLNSLEETKKLAQKARECIRDSAKAKKEYELKMEIALDQITKAGKRINNENNDGQ